MSVIELKDVSYVYQAGMPDEKTAISDIDLSVEAGEFIGIIGHTGSGKSTLIQLLNGLLQPTTGKVIINGNDIWKDKASLRKSRFDVGLVAAGDLGVTDDMLKRSPVDLSGGEKRRVAIAGVLAMEPDILVLDEPTAGLDPRSKRLLMATIENYHKSEGNTVLFVSHSMDDVARYSDRVLVLNGGKIFDFAGVKDIFMRVAELKQIGLSVPAVTDILLDLNDRGYGLDTSFYTAGDAASEIIRYKKGQK